MARLPEAVAAADSANLAHLRILIRMCILRIKNRKTIRSSRQAFLGENSSDVEFYSVGGGGGGGPGGACRAPYFERESLVDTVAQSAGGALWRVSR